MPRAVLRGKWHQARLTAEACKCLQPLRIRRSDERAKATFYGEVEGAGKGSPRRLNGPDRQPKSPPEKGFFSPPRGRFRGLAGSQDTPKTRLLLRIKDFGPTVVLITYVEVL